MHPIVIIPGFGGSILVKKHYEHKTLFNKHIIDNRWMNIEPISPFRMIKWNKDMYMDVNIVDNKVINYKDYDENIKPYDIGGIKGIINIVPEFTLINKKLNRMLDKQFNHSYCNTLCNRLKSIGYHEHINLHGFPYDFRLMLNTEHKFNTFNDLQLLIEKTVKKNNKKAIICAHSLGGLIFKLFLGDHVSQEWITEYIYKYNSINVPYGGIPSMVKSVYYGDYYVNQLRFLFKHNFKLNSGMIMLLPNKLAYNNNDIFLYDEDEIINLESFNSHDYIAFKIWRDLWLQMLQKIEIKININTNIINTCNMLVGTKYLKYTPIECEEGDGMVPLRSLEAYKKIFISELTHVNYINNSSHVDILFKKSLIDLIL